jgi:site-specific DNA-methyltransferase (adenine-specific)
MEIDNIYNMDCLEGMHQMEAESVDLTVTSPPYDNLRSYDNNVGDSWGEHVWKPIIKELFRIVKQGGVVVWVVGDATMNGSETGTSFRQALHAMDCGFNLHDTMIWQKATVLPRDTRIPRYWQGFEYMFVFSKGKPQHFTFLREKCQAAGEKRVAYGGRFGESDSMRLDRREKNKDHRVLDTKPRTNVWKYCPTTNPDHPAPFPFDLAYDHIVSWSYEGDTVFDPFMGSATTALAAIKAKRHFVGFELNKEYFDKAVKRIKAEQAQLTLF